MEQWKSKGSSRARGKKNSENSVCPSIIDPMLNTKNGDVYYKSEKSS